MRVVRLSRWRPGSFDVDGEPPQERIVLHRGILHVAVRVNYPVGSLYDIDDVDTRRISRRDDLGGEKERSREVSRFEKRPVLSRLPVGAELAEASSIGDECESGAEVALQQDSVGYSTVDSIQETRGVVRQVGIVPRTGVV